MIEDERTRTENLNKGKNEPIKMSLSTFFLILAIAVIIVMGYTIYNLYLSNEKNDKAIIGLENEIETFKSVTEKKKEVQNEETKEKVAEKETKEAIVTETKENKYDTFVNSYKNSLSKLSANGDKYQMYVSMKLDIDNTCYVYVDTTSMIAYLYINNENIQIDTNVINVYNGTIGQQGGGDFVFIHKDGTASKCSWSSLMQGKYNVEKIQNAKNIVSVVNMDVLANGAMDGSMTYFLIDIDGNLIKPE